MSLNRLSAPAWLIAAAAFAAHGFPIAAFLSLAIAMCAYMIWNIEAPTKPSNTVLHESDCAVHNAPAYPPGPCDCEAEKN